MTGQGKRMTVRNDFKKSDNNEEKENYKKDTWGF